MTRSIHSAAPLLVALLFCACSSAPAGADGDVGSATSGNLDARDRDDAASPDAATVDDIGPPPPGPDLGTADDVGGEDVGGPARGWAARAPLPGPQQEVAVVAHDGLVYVMGGFDEAAAQLATVVVYDPATDRWARRADFPVRANHMNAVVLDDEIWVTGFLHMGFSPDPRTFRYDPQDDVWVPGPDLPAGRGRGASAVGVIDGVIYVVGGIGSGGARRWVDALDPATGEWTARQDAPRAFDHAAYGVIGRRLVIAAGRAGAIASFVDAVHVYDPATDTWSDGAPIPTARGGVASAVHGGKLYVFGGEGNPDEPSGVFAQAEAYDLASDTWQELAPMRTPRHGFGGATVGDVIYLPGGAPTEFLDAVATHEVYVP